MFFAIGGVPIPIILEPVEAEVLEFGDKDRAADGSYMTRIHDEKEDIPLSTRWMPLDEYATVHAALTGAPPLAATGDLLDTGIYVAIEIRRIRTHSFAAGVHKAIDFIVHEA